VICVVCEFRLTVTLTFSLFSTALFSNVCFQEFGSVFIGRILDVQVVAFGESPIFDITLD